MSFGTIGLIGAMVEEVELLHSHLEQTQSTEYAGIRFAAGIIEGKRVVVCRSGVGKVNAAVCTQLLIDRFGVDAVVFTGVAGALDPALEIGDIVVSSECLQHDVDVTALGYAAGDIPFQETSVYPADPQLIRLAARASEQLFPGRSMRGRILSGDQFIASRERVRMLHQEFKGTCTEMEGAAVAHVCWMNGVPFVVVRSMSDKADGSAHINFPEFTKEASDRSFAIVRQMLEHMA